MGSFASHTDASDTDRMRASVESSANRVGPESSDLAVKEFLLAGRTLAAFYGLELRYDYAPVPPAALPDLLGVTVRPAVPYTVGITPILNTVPPDVYTNYRVARAWFIRAGHHASQIVCRNYLSGLRDRNEYFEFLQKEFNNTTSLAQILLALTNTASKSKDIFTAVVNSTNLGIDSYQTFKFLAPEIETVLPIVEAAQVAMRDYFVDESPPATFAGALNAVSKIEYQCSRSGIRSILTQTLIQSRPQFTVRNGTLYAHEAKQVQADLPGNKRAEEVPGSNCLYPRDAHPHPLVRRFGRAGRAAREFGPRRLAPAARRNSTDDIDSTPINRNAGGKSLAMIVACPLNVVAVSTASAATATPVDTESCCATLTHRGRAAHSALVDVGIGNRVDAGELQRAEKAADHQ